ncbi:hypothetical protein DL767_011173 [Monosporascus sp. MG133]|nr:hypothetical protein DL767_011173 [Monosporascus sp. MG133]
MAEQADTTMADTPMTGTDTSPGVTAAPPKKSQKYHELATSTISAPPWAYAHLELVSSSTIITTSGGTGAGGEELDALQARSYCAAALKQFLGVRGTAIPLDVLKVEGAECWLRLPRDDLGAFAAAVTAWQGTTQSGCHSTLRIRGCSDWLGTLVGRQTQDRLWTG